MKKLKFLREKTFKEEIHRAGWNWVNKCLVKRFHDKNGDVLVDEFIERTFDWDYTFNNDKPQILPHHKQDWIGFIHNPIIIPKPFDIKQTPVNMCARLPFVIAMQNCKGMFTLSDDLEEQVRHIFIQYGFDNVVVETLLHPTPLDVEEFKLDEFLRDPQITCIGYWLRNFEPYWQLKTKMPKNVLLGRLPYAHQIYKEQEKEFRRKQAYTNEKVKGNIIVHKHLENKEFDKFLTNTVVQYLGEDYPFYYNSMETANKKIKDIELIKETYYYLKNMDKSKLDIKTFIKDFEQSNIYQDL